MHSYKTPDLFRLSIAITELRIFANILLFIPSIFARGSLGKTVVITMPDIENMWLISIQTPTMIRKIFPVGTTYRARPVK